MSEGSDTFVEELWEGEKRARRRARSKSKKAVSSKEEHVLDHFRTAKT
jgi:hypothetical protein